MKRANCEKQLSLYGVDDIDIVVAMLCNNIHRILQFSSNEYKLIHLLVHMSIIFLIRLYIDDPMSGWVVDVETKK